MKTCLALLLTAVWLTWPGSAAVAQARRGAATAARRPEAKPKTTSRIFLVKTDRDGDDRDGDRALVIGYPWKVHRRPSVEVRLVTGKDPGRAVVRPLFFRSEYMEGKVTVAVYRCQDKAAGVPVRESLTEKGIELEILGRRNSLAKPSVCVVRRFAREGPGPGTAASDPALGTAAVFCLLPAWAINERLLQLDLPRQDFAEAGKMHVWFLREGTVVWKETIDWPGYPKRTATKPQ